MSPRDESKAGGRALRYYSPFFRRNTVSLEAIREFLGPEMDAVDRVIRTSLHSEVVLVRQVADYIIGGGGKRMRPVLLLLAAGACGYHGPHRHELAAVIEFIHTATLLHDDVVDESSLRRGRPTSNATFGNAASVLVGDFVYSRSFQMMVTVDNMRVMQVLSEATNVIAEGEVLQLMNCRNADLDEAGYLQVIRYKTAKLFQAATQLGAILGQATPEQERGLSEYGMRLGTAFQVIDDVLDYSGDNDVTGKNVGDDLAEGKATLPLIYAMRQGTAAEAQLIRHAIEEGAVHELDAVLAAIRRTGAIDYAKAQARAESAAACAALEVLPHSGYREYLLQLADFAVTRSY